MRMWHKHNTQLANFDVASLRVIWFRWARFWVTMTRRMRFHIALRFSFVTTKLERTIAFNEANRKL
jgi:hypothetical protein